MNWLTEKLIMKHMKVRPDFVIGGAEDPYLRRWYLIPRNRFFNIYLHQFLRPDDDRALHDHSWCWASWMLFGSYFEHRILAGGIHSRRQHKEGKWTFGLPSTAHRVELRTYEDYDGSRRHIVCWTLFLTGPRVRNWGFHCPVQGWVPWQKFTDPDDSGSTGKGCDQ